MERELFDDYDELLYQTHSVCPICFNEKNIVRKIPAKVVVAEDKVFLAKKCKLHKLFVDRLSDNVPWFKEHIKTIVDDAPCSFYKGEAEKCPVGCNLLCPDHKTAPLLVNIDLTNNCNLNCSYCFARESSVLNPYEPSYKKIEETVDFLSKLPKPPACIQFSGGEPTLRKDLSRIVRMASEKGIRHIQVTTNGILIAKEERLASRLKKAGLHILYLKFNGTTPTTNHENLQYIHDILDKCRESDMHIILVPTISQKNRSEVGAILKFASSNIDIVRGVNFQPISFSGRMKVRSLETERYTMNDLINDIESQSGFKSSNFKAPNFVLPLSNLIEELRGKPGVRFTMHPSCGAGTFAYFDGVSLTGVPEFVDVNAMFSFFQEKANELQDSKSSIFKHTIIRAKVATEIYSKLSKFVGTNAPENFAKNLRSVFTGAHKDFSAFIKKNMLYIGAMHFQDVYNFDLERIRRCGVVYAVPATGKSGVKLIPFCSYNVLGLREICESTFKEETSEGANPPNNFELPD